MVSMKNFSIGLALAAVMFIALFSFSTTWMNQYSVTYSPEIQDINAQINQSLDTMYGQAQDDSSTLQESDIYSGSSYLGVITAEPFKVLKNNIDLAKLGLNMTTQVSRLGILPDWVFMIAFVVFLLTLTFLALAAIFKVKDF